MDKINRNINIAKIIYKHLKGSASNEENAMLEIWLKDDRNRDFFDKIISEENLYDGLLEMSRIDTKKHFKSFTQKTKKKKNLRIIKWAASTAAIFTLIISGYFARKTGNRITEEISYNSELPIENARLITTSGTILDLQDSIKTISQEEIHIEKTDKVTEKEIIVQNSNLNILSTSQKGYISIRLSDSSKVSLNGLSSIKYPNEFNKDQRVVYLEGEAYFDIKKDDKKPFIVKTHTAEIEVLGTEFNVNTTDKNECTTTLVEGSIKMRTGDTHSVILSPGQQARIKTNGEIRIKNVDTKYYTAWKRNLFAFKDETLINIIEKISEWHKLKFIFKNKRLKELKYTTIISKDEKIENIIKILNGTNDFNCYLNNEKIIVETK